MTKKFFEEVRAFFMKYDPSRVRLSRKIAATYTNKNHQAAVMKRLKEVYAAGGPDQFYASGIPAPKAKVKTPKIEHVAPPVVEREEVDASLKSVDESSSTGNDELKEVQD
jgi:hypothetical protein